MRDGRLWSAGRPPAGSEGTEIGPQEIAWGRPPAEPTLAPGDVHLWRVDQGESAGPADGPAEWLSADERERMARYRFERHRRRFARRRCALRRILAAYVGAEPAGLRFVVSPRGKPELPDPGDPPLRFNVSHSEGIALIGVTRGPELGVDVEVMRPLDDMDSVAREVFSPAELREYESLPAERRAEGFFNGWTRKEAFLKAQGEGLFGDLAGFDVTLAPGRAPRLLRVGAVPAEAARWSLAALVPAPGAIAAVAVRAGSFALVGWDAAAGGTGAAG